jgi:iron complex transport system ATP-binding protein
MAMIATRELSVLQRLKSASMELQSGEMTGVIGPNGAGKSTLINAIAGVEPFSGELLLDGRHCDSYSHQERAQLIGLLPQLPECAWSLTVRDVVSLGRIPWGDEDSEMIQQAIEWTEISHLASRQINELSGGERARVWFARVLAGQPRVLLADEPVASLDIHYQLAMLELLKRYASEGNVVLVALHDLSLAARYCDRLCLMNSGTIVEDGTPEQVLKPEVISSVFNVTVDINLQGKSSYVLPV